MQNPIEAKQVDLEARLSEARVLEAAPPPPADIPYEELVSAVTSRTDLWRPIVDLPPPKEEPPDWNEILKGVQFTRQVIGTGADIRIRARMSPNDQAGQWVSVGTSIRGARVTEITDSAVVFSATKDGKEYTHRVPR